MILKVECIWCNTKTEFNRYVRQNGEGSYVINYLDIIDKLTKADPYGENPNDTVVGLHLHSAMGNVMNKISNIEDSEELSPKEYKLIYLLKNLTADTAQGVQETLSNITPDECRMPMKLVIINRTDYPKKGVLSRFDTVKFIDK